MKIIQKGDLNPYAKSFVPTLKFKSRKSRRSSRKSRRSSRKLRKLRKSRKS